MNELTKLRSAQLAYDNEETPCDERDEVLLERLGDMIATGDYSHDLFDSCDIDEAITIKLDDKGETLGEAMHQLYLLGFSRSSADQDAAKRIAKIADDAINEFLEDRVDEWVKQGVQV